MLRKVIHTADWHIREQYAEESIRCAKFVMDYAHDCGAQAIFHPGDILGGHFDGQVYLGPLVNELVDIIAGTPVPFYIIEGTKTHERPGAINILSYIKSILGQYIYVYLNPAIIKVGTTMSGKLHKYDNLDPDDITLAGHLSFLPAPSKAFLAKDAKGSIKEINQTVQDKLRTILANFGAQAAAGPHPHIFLGHITVAGSESSTGQVMLGQDLQVSRADLMLAGADYYALGHIHKHQHLGHNIWYSGSLFHQNFGELEPKGINVITFDDSGHVENVEFVETPSTPRQLIDIKVNQEGASWSAEVCGRADVRIRIYGPEHFLTENQLTEIENAAKSINPHSLKIEKIYTAEREIEQTEFSKANTLAEKVVAYGKSAGLEITPEVIEMAGELERAVYEI